MTRLRRFVVNAGLKGCLLTLLVAVAVGFAIRKDVEMGLWGYTVGVLVCTACVAYLFRDVLVEHFAVTGVVMNVLLLVALLVGIVGRRWLPQDEAWFRIAAAAFLGTYLGCYFWLMSDERITVKR